MKALIVEDEPRAQRALENLLKANFPEVEVIGRTASVKETVDWLAGNRPDVIFMDVELADGTCFDIFAQTSVNAQVVMTTAYDNYAVKAFEVNSVDYLLKPVDIEDLRRAVSRLSQRITTGGPHIDFDAVREAFRPREKFLIRLNDRIVPVSVRDIAYFYSEAKSTFIVTRDGKNYVLDDSLDAIEAGLDPKAFFRIGLLPHLTRRHHRRKRHRQRLQTPRRPLTAHVGERHSHRHGPHRLPRPRRRLPRVAGRLAFRA